MREELVSAVDFKVFQSWEGETVREMCKVAAVRITRRVIQRDITQMCQAKRGGVGRVIIVVRQRLVVEVAKHETRHLMEGSEHVGKTLKKAGI
jgi:hypothetical protein